MTELVLSVGEPFTSPAWGCNFVVFAGDRARPIPEQQTKEYLRGCIKYARHYETWLVPERFILLEHQCMGLISPEGKMVGAQRAVFGSPVFRPHAERNPVVEVFPTPLGKVFLCVDADVYHPEIAGVARGLGAQIIVCSQSILEEDYASHMVVTGAWNAAQLAGCYLVAVASQFACVCAPLELTPKRDGFLNPPGLKKPMTGRLDVDMLESMCRPKPLNREFYALHREELVN